MTICITAFLPATCPCCLGCLTPPHPASTPSALPRNRCGGRATSASTPAWWRCSTPWPQSEAGASCDCLRDVREQRATHICWSCRRQAVLSIVEHPSKSHLCSCSTRRHTVCYDDGEVGMHRLWQHDERIRLASPVEQVGVGSRGVGLLCPELRWLHTLQHGSRSAEKTDGVPRMGQSIFASVQPCYLPAHTLPLPPAFPCPVAARRCAGAPPAGPGAGQAAQPGHWAAHSGEAPRPD